MVSGLSIGVMELLTAPLPTELLSPALCSAACRDIRLFYQPALPSCFQEILWSVGAAMGQLKCGEYPNLHHSKGDREVPSM